MNIDYGKFQNIDVPGISAEDINADLKDAFTKIVVNGTHIATMISDDYRIYHETFDDSVENDAWDLYVHKQEELKSLYPDDDIQDIIGFVLSNKLYDYENNN